MKPAENQSSRESTIPALSLFILTFSGLALEISLTRLYSVIFLQGYVYLLISLSMAGLGIGAVLIHYLKEKALPAFFLLVSVFPLFTFGLIVGINLFATQFLISLIPTVLLFVCIGASNTFLFQRTSLTIHHLYFIDLLGAASGAVSSYFLLNALGAAKTIILLLILVSCASGFILFHFFGITKRIRWSVYPLLMIIALLLLRIDLTHIVSPQYNRLKDMSRLFAEKEKEPRIATTRWTAFGRSDLVETSNPLFKTLYIDGAAGTKMLQMQNGMVDPGLGKALKYSYTGGAPLIPIPPGERNHAVVIGSGGGIDVVTLLEAGYKTITAVEINPDFIEIVRENSQYNGGIYDNHPNVEVVNREGRTYIRSSTEPFDLIHMSLPIIKSARNIGSYALTENHLFTYEAFGEYWDALTPNGYLIVVAHYPGEAYRLVSNALKALELRGIKPASAMAHMVLIGHDSTPTLVLRKSIFSNSDAETYYGMIRTLHHEGSTNFVPYVPQHDIQYRDPQSGQLETKPMINQHLYSLSRGETDLDRFIDGLPENASWISDDSPFFYQMEKSLPREIRIVLVITIILTVTLALLFIKSPLSASKQSLTCFLLFGFLGVGFMAVEIAAIQKLVLFLGHETLALSFILAFVLLSSGLGSYVSGRLGMRGSRLNAGIAAIIVFIAAFYFINSPFRNAFLAFSLPVKLVCASMLLFPVFVLMGVPFPELLSRIKKMPDGKEHIPWMLGINAIATMLGGSLSISIAIIWGYSFVFLTGALLYGAVLMVLFLNSAFQG